MFVARKDNVLQHLGKWSANSLVRCPRCVLVVVPLNLHIQGVVALCRADKLLLAPFRQGEVSAHIEGNTRRLLGEEAVGKIKDY